MPLYTFFSSKGPTTPATASPPPPSSGCINSVLFTQSICVTESTESQET